VLVKNTNNALPLKHPRLLSLFGYDAQAQPIQNAGSSVSFGSSNSQIRNQTMFVGGGSGANNPAYLSSPFDAIQQRIIEDGGSIYWDFVNQGNTSSVDPASDACLVFINAWATEGTDRPGIHDTQSDTLVNNIAANCSNTIVVIHNAGVRLVDQFVTNPNVTALIFAHLPGQDSGRALAAILYGDVSPSGKLPYTVAKNESDYGNLLAPSRPEGEYVLFPQSNFSEGVYIDYRHFDVAGITPRYEFGFGLSYTTFAYSDLVISKSNTFSNAPYPCGAIQQGGAADLWDVLVTVSADIKNSGGVAGAEVAQLYLGIPNGPIKVLRGYSKVVIQPGETKTVQFDLMRRDLSEWDVVAQAWKLQSGEYKIYVGPSSRILPLTGSLVI
jgi:beta-glucosidase